MAFMGASEKNREFGDLAIAGPVSKAGWEREQETIGPGLQAVVQWARLTFQRGEGAFLIDADGNTYIDLMGGSGVNSIGHSHPAYVAGLSEQLALLVVSAFTSSARLEMLEVLKSVLPATLDRVQLYSGGTEAVEAALRLAKAHTHKYEFVSFWNGFHGKTLGSLSLTDAPKAGLGPLPPGFHSSPFAHCYRCPFQLKHPTCGLACVEHLRGVIKHQAQGTLAGIVIEPVQGRAGNIPPPDGFLKAVEDVAHENDALLIADESITGFGRTGSMFASTADQVTPDIMVIGKGMGSGYPVTGIVSTTEIMRAAPFSDPSASSSSFGGFPLACKAVETTLNVIIKEGLVQRSAELGAFFLELLKPLEEDSPVVGEVRGKGLMIGIELVEDKESKTPMQKDKVRKVYLELLSKGVLVMVGGNSLRLYPPLSIEAHVLEQAAASFSKVLKSPVQ